MLQLPLAVTVYLLAVAGALGACAASFMGCCAWRMIHREPVTKGRSHCDRCGHILGVWELIPVIGFLLTKGKCRHCGCVIPRRYPAAELLGAAVFISLLLKYDISMRTLQLMVLACVLLGASLADLEGMLIPDRFILLGVAGGLVFPLLTPDRWQALLQAVIGGISVAGALLLWVLVSEKLTGRELMGGGDIKLLLVTGLYLGWMGNFLCLILACVIGIGFGLYARKREAPMPWGPSIALAAWLCSLFGERVIGWYASLF